MRTTAVRVSLLILGGALTVTFALILAFWSRPPAVNPLSSPTANRPAAAPSLPGDQRIPHPDDTLPATTSPPGGELPVVAEDMPRDISATVSLSAIQLQWRGTGKFRVVDYYSVYRSKVEGTSDWRFRPIDWQFLTTVKARAWDLGQYQYTDRAVQPSTTYLYSLSLTLRDGKLQSLQTGPIEVRAR